MAIFRPFGYILGFVFILQVFLATTFCEDWRQCYWIENAADYYCKIVAKLKSLTFFSCCLFFRSNCDSSAANILRQHYKRPYFLPSVSESSKTDWIFMGSPGYGAHMHVRNNHFFTQWPLRSLPPQTKVMFSRVFVWPWGRGCWLSSMYHRSHDQEGLYPKDGGVCIQGSASHPTPTRSTTGYGQYWVLTFLLRPNSGQVVSMLIFWMWSHELNVVCCRSITWVTRRGRRRSLAPRFGR